MVGHKMRECKSLYSGCLRKVLIMLTRSQQSMSQIWCEGYVSWKLVFKYSEVSDETWIKTHRL